MITTESEVTNISFYGTDGCGKSTIASKLLEMIRSAGMPAQMIGGSSYREWLTSGIALDFNCDTDILSTRARSPEEKTYLYEEIAVACYGLMNRLTNENGTTVVIDSDPYLKRMVWAKTELAEDHYDSYTKNFERKMVDRIGDILPEHLVHVQCDESTDDTQQGLSAFDRILIRGPVSSYDPSNVEEAITIVSSTNMVWRQLMESSRYKNAHSKVHYVINATSGQPDLSRQISATAKVVLDEIF